MTRLSWVRKTEAIALARQCVLAGVARATVYAQQKAKLRLGAGVQNDEVLKRLIDEEYTRHPFFGSRKMVVYLRRCEHSVNRQARSAADARHGLGRYGTGPAHQQSAPAAQDVSVFAARRAYRAAQPSLEHRHHLHPAGARFCLLRLHAKLT